jgi:RNA polymerase sigma-70 factor (ECF subfamily)
MQRLTDIAFIAQVLTTGSERAFAQLVHGHQEAVRRFLRRLTAGDEMRADDLAQETFIRAWQAIGSFRQLSGFETWLLRIAYRVFLDDERKRKKKQLLQAPLPDHLEGREQESSSFAMRHDLDLALATLSEAERTCIVLQCMEGRSMKDIAAITAMPENTVKSHLLRGKKNLANYLKRNGYYGNV